MGKRKYTNGLNLVLDAVSERSDLCCCDLNWKRLARSSTMRRF